MTSDASPLRDSATAALKVHCEPSVRPGEPQKTQQRPRGLTAAGPGPEHGSCRGPGVQRSQPGGCHSGGGQAGMWMWMWMGGGGGGMIRTPRGGGFWGWSRAVAPHSPFSRVCRLARTRRKVCRGDTRAESHQHPPLGQRGPGPPQHPPTPPNPLQPPRGLPPPPPRPHLFPAACAGPPGAALHSRGLAARRRSRGPPPAARDAGGCGPARQEPRRSAPGGRRHVGPGHVTRRRAGGG